MPAVAEAEAQSCACPCERGSRGRACCLPGPAQRAEGRAWLTLRPRAQVAGFPVSTELSLGVVASTLSAGVAASLLLPEAQAHGEDGGPPKP